jgi:predicted ThiF/HesA family dinucleotide-utilizing enzyme
MSALPSGSGVAARLAPEKPKTRGFLHIVRHGGGPNAIYILKYHRLEQNGIIPRPVLAESAQGLIELLERIGVNFQLAEVRGALEDILRLGSANIPDLWLSDEEMMEKGLVEG